MSRRKACCEASERLSRWLASEHLRNARRELLLFLREIVDGELERLDHPDAPPAPPPRRGRRRKVEVRRSGARRRP